MKYCTETCSKMKKLTNKLPELANINQLNRVRLKDKFKNKNRQVDRRCY